MGGYVYDPTRSERYPNGRDVTWLTQGLSRDQFTQGCLYEFGSALSVFKIKTHDDEVLSAIGEPVTTAAPDVSETGGASTPRLRMSPASSASPT